MVAYNNILNTRVVIANIVALCYKWHRAAPLLLSTTIKLTVVTINNQLLVKDSQKKETENAKTIM